jgi:GNAT superfamily N-acetyltransferase
LGVTATTEEFEVVRYHRTDRDSVFAFLREALPAADSARLSRQWDWKYDANPFNQAGGPDILLLQVPGQLVAMYGRLVFRVAIDGSEHLAHHGCDLLVHPAYRGRRLSAHLRDRDLIDSPIHFSWQNEASYRVARRDGTAGIPFVSLVRPLDIARVVRGRLGEHRLGRVTGAVVGRALRHMPLFRRHVAVVPEVAVTRIQSFDERYDRLWQRSCRDYPVMIVRDRRYLEWRFLQRPDASYTIMAATRGSEVLGYMVTRCADREGERWGYLVDFLVQERSAAVFGLLLQHALDDLRQAGAAAVSCRVAVPPYRRLLYRHGFMPLPYGASGYIRGRVRLPDQPLQMFGDVRQWFLTMGDGDLEMSF